MRKTARRKRVAVGEVVSISSAQSQSSALAMYEPLPPPPPARGERRSINTLVPKELYDRMLALAAQHTMQAGRPYSVSELARDALMRAFSR